VREEEAPLSLPSDDEEKPRKGLTEERIIVKNLTTL
jgi:hypothetical protein